MMDTDKETTRHVFGRLVRAHALAVEKLTEEQLAEAIRQAVACGDFQRHIHATPHGRDGQSITYAPFRELDRVQSLYHDLLLQVERKFEGESRHETAKRYIREAEQNQNQGAAVVVR
jgi:hypothetical protein